MSFKELPLPSIASLRAVAALKSTHLALVRPARIGLGFEVAQANQKTLAEIEDLLGGPGLLSLPYSLRWLLDAMAGLSVLHRTLGFVHGEVEPASLSLGEDGIGRLMPVVRAHWVRGEPRLPERLYYLAPEKLLGDGSDARSDIFSVGVMLWEAIAGQRLLEAFTVENIIGRLMSGSIPRARAPEAEAWTAPLALIAERAIAVDPTRRFATVAEMREAIESASARYLASTPGMVALFQHPEQRVRGRARDSLAPESQRITMPPGQGAPHEIAAQRLSRPHLSSVDLEEELTRPKVALGKPVVSIAKPKPAEPVAHNKSSLVDTLVGVQPHSGDRESSPGDELTTPFARIPLSRPAPAVTSLPIAPPPNSAVPTPRGIAPATSSVAPKSAPSAAPAPSPVAIRSPVPQHHPTPPYFRSPVSSVPPPPAASAPPPQNAPKPAAAPVMARRSTMSSWPPPVVPASAPPPVVVAPAPTPAFNEPRRTMSWPPAAESAPPPSNARRPPSSSPPLFPMPLPHAQPVVVEPSFELMYPRKRRGVWWLLLAAAVAVGLFAARPWLAHQVAAANGGPAVETPTTKPVLAAPQATPPGPTTAEVKSAEPSLAAPTIASSAPPALSGKPTSTRGRTPRGEHAVIHDTVDPTPTPPPREPEPAAPPEPAATPEPPPPPPPPPPPKPKPPVSDADQYGI